VLRVNTARGSARGSHHKRAVLTRRALRTSFEHEPNDLYMSQMGFETAFELEMMDEPYH
jgi:hypothetical protein